MQLPMTGSWVVQVHAVRPFTIHGDEYFELHLTRADVDAPPFAVRVPLHALENREAPAAGQTLELSFLMGQVTGAAISRR